MIETSVVVVEDLVVALDTEAVACRGSPACEGASAGQRPLRRRAQVKVAGSLGAGRRALALWIRTRTICLASRRRFCENHTRPEGGRSEATQGVVSAHPAREPGDARVGVAELWTPPVCQAHAQ